MTMQNFLFILVSTVLVLLPCVIVLCLALQIHIDRTKGSQDTFSRVVVYCIYIFSLACSLNGYSLHWAQLTSRIFDHWCVGLGFPCCFAFLGSIKAFLTAFFFRRAQMASGLMTRRKRLFFTRFAPCYILVYWATYCITAGASFRGRRVPNDLEYLSSCEFDGVFWIFIFAAGLFDAFNCVSTLYLFLQPLIKVVRQSSSSVSSADLSTPQTRIRAAAVTTCVTTCVTVSSTVPVPVPNQKQKKLEDVDVVVDGVNQLERVTSHSDIKVVVPAIPAPCVAIAALELARTLSGGLGERILVLGRSHSNSVNANTNANANANGVNDQYISLMKWNVTLSAIATISSIATLFLFSVSYGYLTWFLCLGDPLINTLCTFFMLGKNRTWLAACFKKCHKGGVVEI